MNWTSIATFKTKDGASPVCERLREAGLHPEIHGSDPLEKLWFVKKRECCVHVDVPSTEFERGEQMLIDLNENGMACDAIRCPECNSFRVEFPQFTRKSLLTNFFLGLAAETGLVEKDYYCEDCHYTWRPSDAKPAKPRDHMAPDYFVEGVPAKRRS
jgi:hypothetical protein